MSVLVLPLEYPPPPLLPLPLLLLLLPDDDVEPDDDAGAELDPPRTGGEPGSVPSAAAAGRGRTRV